MINCFAMGVKIMSYPQAKVCENTIFLPTYVREGEVSASESLWPRFSTTLVQYSFVDDV